MASSKMIFHSSSVKSCLIIVPARLYYAGWVFKNAFCAVVRYNFLFNVRRTD